MDELALNGRRLIRGCGHSRARPIRRDPYSIRIGILRSHYVMSSSGTQSAQAGYWSLDVTLKLLALCRWPSRLALTRDAHDRQPRAIKTDVPPRRVLIEVG